MPPFLPVGDHAVYDALTPRALALVEPIAHGPWFGAAPAAWSAALAAAVMATLWLAARRAGGGIAAAVLCAAVLSRPHLRVPLALGAEPAIGLGLTWAAALLLAGEGFGARAVVWGAALVAAAVACWPPLVVVAPALAVLASLSPDGGGRGPRRRGPRAGWRRGAVGGARRGPQQRTGEHPGGGDAPGRRRSPRWRSVRVAAADRGRAARRARGRRRPGAGPATAAAPARGAGPRSAGAGAGRPGPAVLARRDRARGAVDVVAGHGRPGLRGRPARPRRADRRWVAAALGAVLVVGGLSASMRDVEDADRRAFARALGQALSPIVAAAPSTVVAEDTRVDTALVAWGATADLQRVRPVPRLVDDALASGRTVLAGPDGADRARAVGLPVHDPGATRLRRPRFRWLRSPAASTACRWLSPGGNCQGSSTPDVSACTCRPARVSSRS